jgi:hypothetical protein
LEIINEGGRRSAEGTLFGTGTYTPLQKLFALKADATDTPSHGVSQSGKNGEVLDPIVLINFPDDHLVYSLCESYGNHYSSN